MVATRTDERSASSPALRSFVDRPRLSAAVATRAPDATFGIVAAPSGYGKTVFLRQWSQQDTRPCVWLTLRPEHAPPLRLRNVLAGQATALAEEGTPVVVVLDDAQVLSTRCAPLLVSFAAELPPGSALIVATTGAPPLPVGRLRLEGHVWEIGVGDLAMTREEARLALQNAGVLLDAEQLARLMQLTEGWPAGVALAALALRDARERPAALATFGGDDHVVADYLRDVFLDALTSEQLDLLVQTSVLDELDGPLCDAIVGRAGSGELLLTLSRENVLVDRTDRCARTFRVHPMLRTMLRAQLRRRGRAAEQRAHLRAATWMERHGALLPAAGQAARAGDVARAGRLLWTELPEAFAHGAEAPVQATLKELPASQLARDPQLALAMALCTVSGHDRDHVDHWLTIAEHAPGNGDRDVDPSVASVASLVRAILGRGGLGASADHARRVRESPSADEIWRAVACFIEGAAQHLQGSSAVARARLVEGARIGAVRAPVAELLCHGQLALMALLDGAWDDGHEHAERAAAVVRASALERHPASALALATSAFAQAYRGSVEDAQRDAAAAARLLQVPYALAPWWAAEIHVALARAQLRLSDSAEARVLLTRAGRLARGCPDTPVIRSAIDDAWARADEFAASAVAGVAALTTAELRVLRMLPSHMSLGEIAGRLHVSLNTVKTQAHAVYRKLDVSSRSEAVACARAVGLIDP